MTDSTVVIVYESDDGVRQRSWRYDTDDYASTVSSREHEQIVNALSPLARNVLGPDARYVRTFVDGVAQPD
jgi:hypothetical protein